MQWRGSPKAVAMRTSAPSIQFHSCVLLGGLRGTGLSYLQGEKKTIPQLSKLGKISGGATGNDVFWILQDGFRLLTEFIYGKAQEIWPWQPASASNIKSPEPLA